MAPEESTRITTPIGDQLRQVRAQYIEMPGLILTRGQARRLFGLDDVTVSALLGALVDAHFLKVTQAGTYVRADVH